MNSTNVEILSNDVMSDIDGGRSNDNLLVHERDVEGYRQDETMCENTHTEGNVISDQAVPLDIAMVLEPAHADNQAYINGCQSSSTAENLPAPINTAASSNKTTETEVVKDKVWVLLAVGSVQQNTEGPVWREILDTWVVLQ